MALTLLALAGAVLDTARAMNESGINRGSAGNVSARVPGQPEAFVITPTGMSYGRCEPQDMVQLSLSVPEGHDPIGLAPLDRRRPSSEWRFHRDIYAAFPEAGAVVHAHSPFATALACQGMPVPAFHYMVGRFGGEDVRCAPYATFGTQALSDGIMAALADRRACLMAHHGFVVHGRDLDEALALAVEFETLCEHYCRTLQLGPAPLLPAEEMRRVLEKFRTYGRQPEPLAPG